MHIRYISKLGIPKDIEITTEPILIGRSREADIPLLDDKVSRTHCGIRLSEGRFYIKDLNSRNGVFLNGRRIEDTAEVKAGDRIQIGSTVFVMEQTSPAEDAAKAIGAVGDSMDEGKGYSTILKEIVDDIVPTEGTAPKPAPEAAAPAAPAPAPAPAAAPAAAPARPRIQLKGITPKPAAAPASSDAPAPSPAPTSGPKKIIIKR
jgi:predicted component of type VI protein secretion system